MSSTFDTDTSAPNVDRLSLFRSEHCVRNRCLYLVQPPPNDVTSPNSFLASLKQNAALPVAALYPKGP